jgi:hypothetical protein
MMEKTLPLTLTQIKDLRERRYHRRPELALQTVEDAIAFLDDVGFCFLFPIKGVELPSLWDAVCGRVKPVPNEHHDPHIQKTWGWKDTSLDKHWWYYGKLLRKKATLVSLKLLPFFYALSENYGDPEDYLHQYHDGRLSHEAKLIYETLLEHGPQHVIELRRLARLTGQSRTAAFQRALAELQADLKILPVGVARAGAWRYAFTYEIVSRWYPDLPEQARPISGNQAQRTLLANYLDNVVATTVDRATRLFGWVKRDVERAAAQLAEAGRAATEVRIEGLRGKHLVSAKAWEGAQTNFDRPTLKPC